MPHGHITRLVPEHGFGFLVDDAGLDWLFIRAGVREGHFDWLWLDERVLFSLEWTPSGPRATEIRFEEKEGGERPVSPVTTAT